MKRKYIELVEIPPMIEERRTKNIRLVAYLITREYRIDHLEMEGEKIYFNIKSIDMQLNQDCELFFARKARVEPNEFDRTLNEIKELVRLFKQGRREESEKIMESLNSGKIKAEVYSGSKS